mmetsp:Transcript_5103/g.13620  ORF Transcript_5103/g.13620 Transcript_5103/m.13620 type:complete len:101 (+) Transcript_5103:443-745(+)
MHMFLITKGAASTNYDPFNQHTVTAFNQYRRAIREGVQQPQAAGEYHQLANAIDVHNQLRKGGGAEAGGALEDDEVPVPSLHDVHSNRGGGRVQGLEAVL